MALRLSTKNTHAEEIRIFGSGPMIKLVEILATNYTFNHPEINIFDGKVISSGIYPLKKNYSNI